MDNILFHLRKNLISIPLVLGGIVVSSYLTGASKQDEIDIYISEYKQFQKEAESASALADSLMLEVEESEQKAEEAQQRANELAEDVVELKAETDNLKNRRDELRAQLEAGDSLSAEAALQMIPIQDSIIEQQDSIIETQGLQITELNSVILRKDFSIGVLTTAVDSLQVIVNNIPPPPPNPNKVFGFIPKPSRTQTFIVGIIVGGVATWKLTG